MIILLHETFRNRIFLSLRDIGYHHTGVIFSISQLINEIRMVIYTGQLKGREPTVAS